MDSVIPAAISFSLLFSHSEAAAPRRELILIVNNSPAFEYILKDTILTRGFTTLTRASSLSSCGDGQFGILRIDYINPDLKEYGEKINEMP